VVRFTKIVDITPNVLNVVDVEISANRSLKLGRAELKLSTNAPGQALINSTADGLYINSLTLSNTGAGGSIVDFTSTDISNIETSLRIVDCIMYDSDGLISVKNCFGFQLNNIGIDNIRNSGIKIGDALTSGVVICIIDSFFMLSPINDDVLKFDLTQPTQMSSIEIKGTTGIITSPTFSGVNITDISKVSSTLIKETAFLGGGSPLFGFDSESPNVTISEDCRGVIPTPTNYWASYKDLATQTTPIVLPNAAQTKITNDGLGGIEKHLPSTITDLWDTVASKVRLTDIPLGRSLTVIIEMDIDISQNNTTISLYGIQAGGGAMFPGDTIVVARKNAPVSVIKWMFIDVVDASLQTNGLELFLRIDDPPVTADGTVKINNIIVKRG